MKTVRGRCRLLDGCPDSKRLARFFLPSAWASNRLARRRFLCLLARNRQQHFTLPPAFGLYWKPRTKPRHWHKIYSARRDLEDCPRRRQNFSVATRSRTNVPASIAIIAMRIAASAVRVSKRVTVFSSFLPPMTFTGLPSARRMLARHLPGPRSNAFTTNRLYSTATPTKFSRVSRWSNKMKPGNDSVTPPTWGAGFGR